MKLRYSLKIHNPGISKIQSIKLTRIVTGMGLKEAKIMVDDGFVEVDGERSEPTLNSDERALKLMAVDLERTTEHLSRDGVRFTLSLSPSVEIRTGTVEVEPNETGSIFQCPVCGKGVDDMIHADRNHLGLCHDCRLIFWAASKLFSYVGTEEEQRAAISYWTEEKGYRIHEDDGLRNAKPQTFDRDRFYVWRNRLSLDATQGKHTVSKFSSGGVTIEGTTYEDGGISWVCRFSDGGPEFRDTSDNRGSATIAELEDLLAQAGMIWWG